jgi:hypothetical protein
MERLLRGGVIVLTLMTVTNPVAARTPVAPRPVLARASLIVVDTPRGFSIVAARSDISPPTPGRQLRIGSSTSIDAKILKGSGRP